MDAERIARIKGIVPAGKAAVLLVIPGLFAAVYFSSMLILWVTMMIFCFALAVAMATADRPPFSK